jgi:peptidase E
MSMQKPIYLMAGGRGESGKTTRAIIRTVLKETGEKVPNVAYVGAASDDNWIFFQMISAMMKKATRCQVNLASISSPKADLKKAKQLLKSANAVFISGGDVERGMEVLAQKNLLDFFQSLYQEGQTFFGASAGSIMLAREWVRWRNPEDDSTAELFPCLNMAPVICDTHAESDDWEELKAALQLKGDKGTGCGIATGTCLKVHPDGKLEALGGPIRRYVNLAGKVELLADLVP